MPNVIQTDHQADRIHLGFTDANHNQTDHHPDPTTFGLHRCQLLFKLIIKPTEYTWASPMPNDTQTDHQADPNTLGLHRCQIELSQMPLCCTYDKRR